MRFYVNRALKFSVWMVVGLCEAAMSPADAALLDGEEMKVQFFYRATFNGNEFISETEDFVVGPGVEVNDFGNDPNVVPPIPAFVDIDISDTQILVTLIIDQPQAFIQSFRILEVDDDGDTIPSFTNRVTVNSSTTWAGFTPSADLDASGNVITVLTGGLQGLIGQFILLDIVPEPTAAGLLAAGGEGIATWGRGRRHVLQRWFNDYKK